jgi:hypothetical protein
MAKKRINPRRKAVAQLCDLLNALTIVTPAATTAHPSVCLNVETGGKSSADPE